jgi:hypothetical protein
MTSRMKKRVWSDPDKQWEGFKLTRYSLDPNKVAALSIAERRQVDGKQEDTPTTLEEIFARLKDRSIKVEEGFLQAELIVDDERKIFAGPAFSQDMLMTVLKLRGEGVEPFHSEWYFFDHDSVMDDPHEHYAFFIVFNDKIVRERVVFSDYHGSGFDPDVFKADDDSDSIWANDTAWTEARIRFCYKKFYSETRIGQLMLLRDDDPEIHGRHKVIANPEHLMLASVFTLVRKIHLLLWVLIVLVGLILFRLWK